MSIDPNQYLGTLFTMVHDHCEDYKQAIENITDVSDFRTNSRLLFRILNAWQNKLYAERNQANIAIVSTEANYDKFRNSQKVLNKIKRKFNKLILEVLTPLEKEQRIQHYVQSDQERAKYILEHFGYNETSFKSFCSLNNLPIHLPDVELLDLSHCVHKDDPGILLIESTKAIATEALVSPNAWDYRGQDKTTPLTDFLQAFAATNHLLNQHRSKFDQLENSIKQRNRWTRLLGMSKFTSLIYKAKFSDGNFIQQCGERSARLFYRLVRERKFNYVAHVSIKANPNSMTPQEGNHSLIIASPPNDLRKFVLETWNSAMIYPFEKMQELLKDCADTDDMNGNAILRDFDPNTQRLLPNACSIFSLDDFKAASKTQPPQLLKLLEQFHRLVDRKEKMLKALEIIHFIESKMPLYEIFDKAVHELYDQLVFLTKKEQKNGLVFTPPIRADHCWINEALQRLDMQALDLLLSEKKSMDSLTILHAIKAALRSGNYAFYYKVMNGRPPLEHCLLTEKFYPDPDSENALARLTSYLLYNPL